MHWCTLIGKGMYEIIWLRVCKGIRNSEETLLFAIARLKEGW